MKRIALLLVLSAACGGAAPYRAEPRGSRHDAFGEGATAAEPEPDVSVETYADALAVAQRELAEHLAGGGEGLATGAAGPDCEAAPGLRDRICELSERICELSERAPDPDNVRRCEAARAACEQARADVAQTCPAPTR